MPLLRRDEHRGNWRCTRNLAGHREARLDDGAGVAASRADGHARDELMTQPLAPRDGDDRERAEQLFSDALTLPPSDRISFITSACAEDVELRTELLSLLDHAEPAEEFFHSLG